MTDPEQITVSSRKAWLLPLGNRFAAIGEFEMAHIITGWQRYMPIPRSPVWCRYVFIWQGRVLPLLDLGVYLDPARTTGTRAILPTARDIVGIVAYEDPQGNIGYGGLRLSAPPAIRSVTDDGMCDYPAGNTDWSRIALSCFETSETGPVPVLDITRIFCTPADSPASTIGGSA